MANFIHGFTCIQSPFSQTRTKPEPDPKPGFCGLPNPKPKFSKKAPGLESLVCMFVYVGIKNNCCSCFDDCTSGALGLLLLCCSSSKLARNTLYRDAPETVNILFITQKRIYYKKIALINLFKAMSTINSVLTDYML